MYDLIFDSELGLSGDSPNEHSRWTDTGFPVKGKYLCLYQPAPPQNFNTCMAFVVKIIIPFNETAVSVTFWEVLLQQHVTVQTVADFSLAGVYFSIDAVLTLFWSQTNKIYTYFTIVRRRKQPKTTIYWQTRILLRRF